MSAPLPRRGDFSKTNTEDRQLCVVQVFLFAVFALVGNMLLPGLSALGRFVFILSMMQTGLGLGTLAVAHYHRDLLAVVPAIGQVTTGALLGVISATQL